MRIVIGYDGSACAKAAINDLSRAGLPHDISATVITAVEPWPETVFMGYASSGGGMGMDTAILADVGTLTRNALAEAEKLAHEGEQLVQVSHPEWHVTSEASDQSPADAIITAAEQHGAELVVMGTRGRSALRRLLAGSVSQKVMRYAPCSVRGVHERAEHATGPLRLIVAYDASPQSEAVLEEVAGRSWPEPTAACLLTVFELRHATGMPQISGTDDAIKGLQKRCADALAMLRDVGLEAELTIRSGDPKHVLLEETVHWGADCVFLGPHGLGRARRFLVGSVSASVFAGAHCTVEVVRRGGGSHE